VLINFISNAVKFTETGSITVEAQKVELTDHQSEIMVIVADTGTGISEKDRSKLFQPFSQVDDSPTRKAGGTGLGLSISRSIIELHHGRIGLLESEPGKGASSFSRYQSHPKKNHNRVSQVLKVAARSWRSMIIPKF